MQDSPNFTSSRLGLVLCSGAIRTVEPGVTGPEEIDKAMALVYGYPVGPLRLVDLVGLDVQMDAATYLHEALAPEVFHPPELLERMVQEGKPKKRSGEGFFSWDEDGRSDEC